MLNFPALDVALGLIFVYFILALICSAINEAIATAARWRAHDLERGLKELLRDPEHVRGELAALQELMEHPLVAPMIEPARKAEARAAAQAGEVAAATARRFPRPVHFVKKRILHMPDERSTFPSYIPSRTFATALLGLSPKILQEGEKLPKDLAEIEAAIRKIPSRPVQEALSSLLHSSQGNAVRFRISVEQWYDDHMERVSGWYRRRVQKVLFALSIFLAFAVNADSLQIAKRLWTEPSLRAAMVSQASNATTNKAGGKDAPARLSALAVPLGWHLATARHDPQGFPFYEKPSMIWALLSKLVGLMLTAIALTLGAPFWFDTLSKLARLRNSGAPPPASDAVRKGEGEEKRRGEGSPPAE